MTASIHIVGLGSGDPDHLTLGIWRKLQSSGRIFLRTEQHPVVELLREHGVTFQSFDETYEQEGTFQQVYRRIVDQLLQEAGNAGSTEPVMYAVPGHPMVAEQTVRLLLEEGPVRGIDVQCEGGESFLDRAFLALRIDPIEGFQLLDATAMGGFPTIENVNTESGALYRGDLQPRRHLLIGQVYDNTVASDVKLTLMEVYPPDYPVKVAHELGVKGKERIETIPLHELDHGQPYGNLSMIFVPGGSDERLRLRHFDRLHEIVAILRSPDGCPWDREQTHASIRRNLIEETYEVLETIDDDDPDAMCEELGDVLLQIMLHSQMEEETGAFTVYDVIQTLNEKLIRRHPHVFGEKSADDAEDALVNWNEIKKQEKADKGVDPAKLSVLSGIPRELPGLLKALELQKKAAKVGFDWDRIEDVQDKVMEEWAELTETLNGDKTKQLEEFGDLLFALVNLARFLKLDPDEALAAANRKFMTRFSYIEEQLRLKGVDFAETTLAEMESFWQEAKSLPVRP
ncbi:nucleoside triphosphate pyrophosphohydrolase [Paenibacillus turpanensis]|uniref:nucleoside triphosphate pyrophosphohydrolase n=1 Tax=Paenibacillus turpanensis TaxID=2689078 RepID=UPI0014079233|nr:nucleoside triphosphate pyrophosphohydrolase [Paenibacillus turpanensis]